MAKYQCFDPGTEVMGKIVSSLVTNILHDDINNILVKNQLESVNLSRWYPFQALLDVLNDISAGYNYSEDFVAIGMAAGKIRFGMLSEESLQDSLYDYLYEYGNTYSSAYRNGDPGYMSVEYIESNHQIMRVRTPYPDDLIYGVLYALVANHCKLHHRAFTLEYDGTMLRREEGGEETVHHIWLE